MRNKHLHLVAGATIAAFAGLAVAQSSPAPSASPSTSTAPSVFTKLDSDKNGMVSKKEASKNKDLASKWDTLDTNKDGNLDQGEFAAFETSATTSTTPKY